MVWNDFMLASSVSSSNCMLIHSLSLSSNLPTHACAEVEDLGSKELVLAEKTVTIEIKANEQGKFVKILEVISTDHWSIYHQYTVLPPTPCPWEMGAGDGWKDSLWW